METWRIFTEASGAFGLASNRQAAVDSVFRRAGGVGSAQTGTGVGVLKGGEGVAITVVA